MENSKHKMAQKKADINNLTQKKRQSAPLVCISKFCFPMQCAHIYIYMELHSIPYLMSEFFYSSLLLLEEP